MGKLARTIVGAPRLITYGYRPSPSFAAEQQKSLYTSTSTYTCMTSVNITITKEAYDFLKKLKQQDHSFSEVILLMKKKRQDVLSYAGIFRDVDLTEAENVRKKARQDWAAR
ncbi:antitoxin VapB family protein [Candidatus Woesearchaeota archaeon]|nr:antitoxin VapB family protein [Candidatus Woesearchaeota archaeon]